MERNKIKISSQENTQFEMSNIRNWDVIVDNVALVLLNTRIREYVNIDAFPKIKRGNMAELKYSCLLKTGGLDEYILNFDILGCADLGYNSEVSKVWRDCLEANFGEKYNNFVAKKLLNATNEHSC